MAVFTYKAIDASRAAVEGTITADTARHARDELRMMGLSVREISIKGNSQNRRWWNLNIGYQDRQQSTTAIRELATLLGAGIPILQSLETVSLQHHGRFLTTMTLVRDKVQNGSSLADAIAEHPSVFDSLSVHMVGVGEATGTLDAVLAQLADFKERSMHLKDRVKSALAYPAFLMIVMLGVTTFLMTVVLPNLLDNLTAMGQQLPLPTRIIKAISDFLVAYGWLVLLLTCAAICVAIGLIQTERGKFWWHGMFLKIPVIGTLARKQSLAQVSLILSTLLKSGLVFDKAAEITAASTRNVVVRQAINNVKTEVGAGQEMGNAFEKWAVFPPVMVQIFRVGQESGQLEPMLDRLAIDYDRQVEVASDRLAALVEPILILMLAVVVGIIMAAVILPILEAGKVV